jgi:hypothetical protein
MVVGWSVVVKGERKNWHGVIEREREDGLQLEPT